MKELLIDEPGRKVLLLSNEAIVRGAIEGGVRFATTYPGTPSSEIGDTFAKVGKQAGIYFEYAVNEKVAFELATAACASGARCIVSMKHVGVNVTADSLMTLVYEGVRNGFILVSADDPGCHSSQNEQDNRYYARLAGMPLLEPSTAQEAKDMVVYGLDISEQLELPVLLRTTTRVSHHRGIVTYGPIRRFTDKFHFEKNPTRFVPVPAIARIRHPWVLKQLEKAKELANSSEFNRIEGSGSIGIITSGISYLYLLEAIYQLDLTSELSVLKLGFTYPFPDKLVLDFLKDKKRVLVVEELEPLVENEVRILAQKSGLDVKIYGKGTGGLRRYGEFNIDIVKNAVAEFSEIDYQAPKIFVPEGLPPRPPALCPGCPHRHTYYAAKIVTKNKAVYPTDIGCYTLGLQEPLKMADFFTCMGSSVTSAGGFSKTLDIPIIAYIGDSTFFHSGITGLIDAVHNNHNFILVILDNRTTAMTGHQPHPGLDFDAFGEPAPAIDLVKMIKGLGVEFVRVVDPNNLKQTIKAFEDALEYGKLAVIISKAPCILLELRDKRRRGEEIKVYQIDNSKCNACHHTIEPAFCATDRRGAYQMERVIKKIDLIPEDMLHPYVEFIMKTENAPCTVKCPANICIQGYLTLAAAGKYQNALELIRDKVPIPAILGRVCHAPCEDVCIRKYHDEKININMIKRFVAQYEPPFESNNYFKERLKRAPKLDKKVAIIGSGPAGLAAAYDLIFRGYKVTIFEKENKAGGLLYTGIPEYRLPRDVLEKEINILEKLGIEFKLGVTFGKDITWSDLKQQGYSALVLAVGAGKGTRLNIENEEVEGVWQALEFLYNYNVKRDVKVGEKVAVIGGGDAAIDSARVALRLGAKKVYLIYRRSREEMPASETDVEMMIEEGVEIHYLATPIKVISSNGKVEAVQLQRMKLGEPDESGRRRPIPIEGSTYTLDIDTLIEAIGQKVDNSFIEDSLSNLKTNRKGLVEVDPLSGKTSIDGVFACGDVVLGPSTVIDAIRSGKIAAFGVDKYIQGNKAMPLDLIIEPIDSSEAIENLKTVPAPKREKIDPPVLDRFTRKGNFKEIIQDITPEQAQAESRRCLACAVCAKCNACIETFSCPAIYVDDNNLIKINELLCTGCGVCAELCPNGAIMEVSL